MLADLTTLRLSFSVRRTDLPSQHESLLPNILSCLLLCGALASAQVSGPASINIQITEGDGLTHLPGSASYRGLSIRVSEPSGGPVSNAKVTFQLPDTEPSGTFPNGTRTEHLTTDAKGTASVWGIKWGATPGLCNISVIAKAGSVTAGTVARVLIGTPSASRSSVEPETVVFPSFEVTVAVPAPLPAPEQPAATESPETVAVSLEPVRRPGILLSQTTGRIERLPSPWPRRVLILLAVAGCAGGLAAYKVMSKQAPTATFVPGPVPTPLVLSSPSITIGKP
jgi:hypothetical protein